MQSLRNLFSRFLPESSYGFLNAKAQSLADLLPYEGAIVDKARTLFLMSDDAIGTIWELEPLSHEILSGDQFEDALSQICKVFEMVSGSRVTLQFIFDSRSSERFVEPEWSDSPQTFAQRVAKHRIGEIKKLAFDEGDKLKLMRRRVFLTLRVELKASGARKRNLEAQIYEKTDLLTEAVHRLRDHSNIIEDLIESQCKMGVRNLTRDEVVFFLRDSLHDMKTRADGSSYFKEQDNHNPYDRLSRSMINGHVRWSGDAVGVGQDTWEVMSWSGQANQVFDGMMTELLKVDQPIRCVLNVRPTNNTSGLDAMADAVKNGGDAARERQREEVMEAEKRLVYGEKLLSASFHIFFRNTDLGIDADTELRQAQNFCQKFQATTNIPVFVEKFAAFSVFMACLPLCYSRKVAGYLARECRVLSGGIGPYLPIFAGTKGSPNTGQLMQSRAGEALWISLRSSATNPHLAVLGSSGGGKSFWLSNYILSELAHKPDTMVFHVDLITSCEYTAKACGEDGGYSLYKPPKGFPNIFAGEINPERLPTIISVINVAVNLVSEAKLDAAEKVLLGDAILKTYKQNRSYATSKYVMGEEGLGRYETTDGKIRVPRLSEVVDSFSVICQEKSISEEVGQSLREKLLPFFGSGPYSIIFDQEAYAAEGAKAPTYSLYDLQGIQADKVLTTLTSLIIISEIERIADEPANAGRSGLLIIDELAVTLGGNSEELEEYVKAKWITLRKKGWVCIGLTNAAYHYADIAAPASIWRVSANKLILPMNKSDIADARKKGLITDQHHLALIGSLQKKRGSYSEGLLIGECMQGSFCYVPTGFDYWLAANQRADVENIEAIYEAAGSYQKAIEILANHYPMGKVGPDGQPCVLSDSEKTKLIRLIKEVSA